MHASLTAERDTVAGDWATLADDCISAYVDAGKEHACLCGKEMALEAQRPALLAVIRGRILGDPAAPNQNPVTGKAYSATAAEDAARIDPEYLAYLAHQSETVTIKNTAYTLAQAAWLRAELSIARFKVSGGLR